MNEAVTTLNVSVTTLFKNRQTKLKEIKKTNTYRTNII